MFKAAQAQNEKSFNSLASAIANFLRRRPAREVLIFIAFCLFTVVMTWPWVLHLRDAVADRGDPYMIAWTLWWDYHQTFHNPLHLFDANIFYPYRYTLAFSENDYGIAVLFFPLFAAGFKPLTIHSIATFLGFAFSGYGAFRLTRTLTGRNGPAWIAGIVFAFIPFRFHVLSHLHYLFAGWIPLTLESLVLFARRPGWRRAGWMGTAFFMNGLSCISWLIMTVVPLGLTVIFLLFAHQSLWRSRTFWIRGVAAIAVASLALFPFLWPYYKVSVIYGLKWQPWEFAFNSPSLIHWLKADGRNRIWQNLGASIPGGHNLFPGLLAPLLAIASLRLRNQLHTKFRLERWLLALIDFVIVAQVVSAILILGYGDKTYRLFGLRLFRLDEGLINQTITILILAVGLRIVVALPALIRRLFRNLKSPKGSRIKISLRPTYLEAIGVGVLWTVTGFLSSLGANFFFNRWLHDYLFLYQSIRIPSRAAMTCYVGLAVLAGVGASCLADRVQQVFSSRRVRSGALLIIGLAVLFELHASPLRFESGEVDPSKLSLRLRQTPMSGGLVELPSDTEGSRHFYMLRAADHGKPLVNATSSFISPFTDQINKATDGKIAPDFMDLLEKIPASYLVVHNDRLLPGWQTEYEMFLTRSLMSGRLLFINRFDGHDDLYAVVKTEPGAKGEAPVPFPFVEHEWSAMIDKDESNILSPSTRSQELYRLYLATTGSLPRYADFMRDIRAVGRGVIRESENEDSVFQSNLSLFADDWVSRQPFNQFFSHLDDARYVDRLVANSGFALDPAERTALIYGLAGKSLTRATVLLKIVTNQRFIEKEHARSMVLLNYFAYLHRNPDDPPDRDLRGFNFWIKEFARQPDAGRLSSAFQDSFEYRRSKEGR
jgi:hypothetical protein